MKLIALLFLFIFSFVYANEVSSDSSSNSQSDSSSNSESSSQPSTDSTSGTCGNDCYWNVDGEKLIFSGTGEMNESLTKSWNYLSSTIRIIEFESNTNSSTNETNENNKKNTNDENKKVYGIVNIPKSSFAKFLKLEFVTLSNTITIIDDNAFANCPVLKSINFPMGLKTLGHTVFENCVNLKRVDIPSSVNLMQKDTFKNCKNIEIIFRGTQDPCNTAVSEVVEKEKNVIIKVSHNYTSHYFCGIDMEEIFYILEDGIYTGKEFLVALIVVIVIIVLMLIIIAVVIIKSQWDARTKAADEDVFDAIDEESSSSFSHLEDGILEDEDEDIKDDDPNGQVHDVSFNSVLDNRKEQTESPRVEKSEESEASKKSDNSESSEKSDKQEISIQSFQSESSGKSEQSKKSKSSSTSEKSE